MARLRLFIGYTKAVQKANTPPSRCPALYLVELRFVRFSSAVLGLRVGSFTSSYNAYSHGMYPIIGQRILVWAVLGHAQLRTWATGV